MGAALAAGGKVGQVAKAANVTQNLAQNNLAGAAQAAGGGVAKVANLADKATTLAQQNPDELNRIKQLANV
jgi:hypothetical protein